MSLGRTITREVIAQLRGKPPKQWANDSRVAKKAQPGRNEPCPCGSGDKFKSCHGKKIR